MTDTKQSIAPKIPTSIGKIVAGNSHVKQMFRSLHLCGSVVMVPIMCWAAGTIDAAKVRIESPLYAVEYNAAQGLFTVQGKASGKTFVSAGRLEGGGVGQAKVISVTDPKFGEGQGLEIRFASGNRNLIALYPKLPFVLIKSVLHNGSQEVQLLNKVEVLSAALDLGKMEDKLRTLGTGGLLPPAKNPGSYAFLAVADPATRAGVVGGWLTHDRGSGVVFSPVNDGVVSLQARIDYGCLRIKPGADVETETMAIGYFSDARFGLEAYADAIAKVYSVRLPPNQAGYCTWYMEKHGGSCDEKHLQEISAYASKNLKPFGFDFIQIDDGWQTGASKNGPNKNFTTHHPNGAYRSGMKDAANNIKKFGLTPGIWFMPFAGTWNDPFFAERQNWFVKTLDGKPYDTDWGGTCLDMTNPTTREYVRSVVARISHDWGYKLFKLDGFWTGSATKQIYVNNGYQEDGIGDAVFSDKDVTNIEALRSGTKLIREAAGPNVFLLGCCVSQNMRSFGGTFGLLDAMRVGPDTGADQIGAPHASRLWFLNSRVWWNDPDCVSVRKSVPIEQARLNASFTAMADALFYNSDWMPDFPAERLDILRRCMPAHNLPSRPVDVFENQPATIWHLPATNRETRRDLVALYNWDTKKPLTISCPVERIGLPKADEYVGYEFWTKTFIPPFKDTLSCELPRGAVARIVSVKPVTGSPTLVSTSRHITQGIIDVADETWDKANSRLSATSQLVANDPYEIRIVIPVGKKSWKATKIGIAAEDEAAGVKVDFKQDGPKVIATIKSLVSRTVKWEMYFKQSPISASPAKAVENLKSKAEYGEVTLTWDETGDEAYRITRDDGKTFVSMGNSFFDNNLTQGKTISYKVEALNFEGKPGNPAIIQVVPTGKPIKPPQPSIYLDGLKLKFVENGFGKANINKNISGQALSVAGNKYEHGIGVHARAVVKCVIPDNSTRFVALVGLDDKAMKDPRASVVFEVYGDVRQMGEAPVLLGKSPELKPKTIGDWSFDIELNSRYRELHLIVTDAGDGIAADHANWVDAGFLNGTIPQDKTNGLSEWRQDKFMISAFGGPTNDAQAAAYAEAKFNTVMTKADQLDLCAKHSLRSIVMDVTPEKARSLKDHPAVWGWFVKDEPVTKEFVKLAPTVAAFHEADPNHPAYVNLAGWEDLNLYFKTIKPRFLSYDVYQWWGARKPLCGTLERHRVAADKAGVPYFCWVESNADWRYANGIAGAGYFPDNAAMLRNSVWLALAHGVRGIQWFTGGLVFDNNGKRTHSGEDVAAINRELEALGPVLMTLRCEKVFHTDPVPDQSVKALPDFEFTSPDRDLTFGVFAGPDNQRHVIVVNREVKVGAATVKGLLPNLIESFTFVDREAKAEPINEERSVEVRFKPPYEVERFNTTTRKWDSVNVQKANGQYSISLKLPSGGGALIRCRTRG